eukprot:gene54828-biopygen48925
MTHITPAGFENGTHAFLETCVGCGWNDEGQADPPCLGGRRATAIAAGRVHSLAILDDGSVLGWGGSPDGQLDVPRFAGRRAVAVAAASPLPVDTLYKFMQMQHNATQCNTIVAFAAQVPPLPRAS